MLKQLLWYLQLQEIKVKKSVKHRFVFVFIFMILFSLLKKHYCIDCSPTITATVHTDEIFTGSKSEAINKISWIKIKDDIVILPNLVTGQWTMS